MKGYCLINDILFVDRLGAGTTRLCAGIVSVAKPISIECQMSNYSNGLYEQLEKETGIKTGLHTIFFQLFNLEKKLHGIRMHLYCIYSQFTFYFHFLLSFRLCEDRVTVSGPKSGSLYLSEASGIQTKVRYHNFCFNAYTFESSCWAEFIIIVVICNADIDRLVLFFPFVLITTHNVCLCFHHSSESWESTVILLSPKR